MLRAINNARVVGPDGVLEGASVVIESGRIAGVFRGKENDGNTLDAAGRFVMPGMLDLHSDAIEKQFAPRPGVEFSPELAFLATDMLFASSGITTGFHAISFMEYGQRSLELGRKLCDLVVRFRDGGLVRHELHLRCELPQEASVEATEALLRDLPAKIVSMMDHTPGQGQYRNLEWYRRYQTDHGGASEAAVEAAISKASPGGPPVLPGADRVARAARKAGSRLASHDDDTVLRVEVLAEKGIRISEFPINAESARRAKELGLSVCMGAPNVVRGRSSGGNFSATEAVSLGLVDALCSDYHPPSMLQAVFGLAKREVLPLHEAVGLVSSGPCRAVGLGDRGEIREGALADLNVVGERFGLSSITHTLAGGEIVLASGKARLSGGKVAADAS